MMRSEVVRGVLAGATVLLAASAQSLAAQTDYYNTDEGRPLRVEDAYPVERHGFEIQLAPIRVARESGGAYHWEVEPELAYGILPRTQVEIGLPLAFLDAGGDRQTQGLAGISLAALHNLNVETTLPAFAVGGKVVLPVGGLAADRSYSSVKAIATRTFGFARFHANGEYTFGSEPSATEDVGEASRWMAGLAVDRTLPLRSLLISADVFAEQPLLDGEELSWTAEAGLRHQTSPQFNLDLGVGRRFAGADQGWFFTFGLARAFAVRSLIPLR